MATETDSTTQEGKSQTQQELIPRFPYHIIWAGREEHWGGAQRNARVLLSAAGRVPREPAAAPRAVGQPSPNSGPATGHPLAHGAPAEEGSA